MVSNNAYEVLRQRYLIKGADGNPIETPKELFARVAKAVANANADGMSEDELATLTQTYLDTMTNLEFLPNSPTLMNAGRELGQLSACFVLPIDDSMEGIFDAIKNAALIHKSGGGTGFSFSSIRGKGGMVNTTGGFASGPISFMKVFNAATEAIKQGGVRRGANMGILSIDHPDIVEFITCKQDNKDITNFNLSVAITDEFLQAVTDRGDYPLIDPHTKQEVARLDANSVLDMIIDNAWNNGEPGIVFIDRINEHNPTPALGRIESTNPCGEQPLLPYEACNLGSINLSKMINDKSTGVDYDRLTSTIDIAVGFLDDVISVNKYPLDEIAEQTLGTRKIGLGVMGWSDMLYKLGIPYDSSQAVDLAQEVMGHVNSMSKKASQKLAEKKGVFPYYDSSVYADQGIKMRNATTTTIAPTGTLSIIANTSSGVEPTFAICYTRTIMDGQKFTEVNPVFEQTAKDMGFYSQELMDNIAKAGSIKGFDEIPDEIKRVYVTAMDIAPQWHVRMQAAFQSETDNAVSKTVNLPSTATKDDVRQIYMMAYELGCKGTTVYRDGSREQVLNIGSLPETSEQTKANNTISPRQRPGVTSGFTEKVKIGCGNLYITVNYDETGICEVFTNLGRGGGCPSQSEATSRLISVALRSGVEVSELIEQVKGIKCMSTVGRKGLNVKSCPDAIGRVMEKVMKLSEEKNIESVKIKEIITIDKHSMKEPVKSHSEACPECGEPLDHESGCVSCRNCFFAKCGG